MKRAAQFFLSLSLLTASCISRQQPKSFSNTLSADDSLSIELGQSEMIHYHSPSLGLDITYPSYLRHQLTDDEQMEVFMTDDVSLSFMVQQFDGDDIVRSPGQQLMGMGAELVESTDRYSIHAGSEGSLDYYGKVIDDSARVITVILRYHPDHAEAVASLKQLVNDFLP